MTSRWVFTTPVTKSSRPSPGMSKPNGAESCDWPSWLPPWGGLALAGDCRKVTRWYDMVTPANKRLSHFRSIPDIPTMRKKSTILFSYSILIYSIPIPIPIPILILFLFPFPFEFPFLVLLLLLLLFRFCSSSNSNSNSDAKSNSNSVLFYSRCSIILQYSMLDSR